MGLRAYDLSLWDKSLGKKGRGDMNWQGGMRLNKGTIGYLCFFYYICFIAREPLKIKTINIFSIEKLMYDFYLHKINQSITKE
jgi:hypothetical protein